MLTYARVKNKMQTFFATNVRTFEWVRTSQASILLVT